MGVDVTATETEPYELAADSVARATAWVALGNVSSRVLGLAREIILSNLFGASVAVDAFKIAIIVPRGLYDLLIGGHVNSALVPVLSDYAEREKNGGLWGLVSALLNLIIIAMATLVIVCLVVSFVLLAPSIVLGYAVKAADREDAERGL